MWTPANPNLALLFDLFMCYAVDLGHALISHIPTILSDLSTLECSELVLLITENLVRLSFPFFLLGSGEQTELKIFLPIVFP